MKTSDITPEYIESIYAKHGYTPGHTWATYAFATKRDKCACPMAMLCIDKLGGPDEWSMRVWPSDKSPVTEATKILDLPSDFVIGIARGFDSHENDKQPLGYSQDWHDGYRVGRETARLLDCVPI